LLEETLGSHVLCGPETYRSLVLNFIDRNKAVTLERVSEHFKDPQLAKSEIKKYGVWGAAKI
jgi:hypothetical protein